MSLTPFDCARAWIWVPTVLSLGAMTRTFAPCVMSACACASSVASLPCALSILNSDELYPAVWKAFVKYGKSELTHRVDEVVSGMSTPTRPLPAACKSFSVAMAAKLTSNEETLMLAGTTAGDAAGVPPPPPQATATSPMTPIIGISLANLIWFFLLSKSPVAFFPERSGARVRRRTGLTQKPHGGSPAGAEHVLRPHVCQECDRATHTICSNS